MATRTPPPRIPPRVPRRPDRTILGAPARGGRLPPDPTPTPALVSEEPEPYVRVNWAERRSQFVDPLPWVEDFGLRQFTTEVRNLRGGNARPHGGEGEAHWDGINRGDVAVATHRGGRASQEDGVFARPEVGLYVVADGMGGHGNGEGASAAFLDTLELGTDFGGFDHIGGSLEGDAIPDTIPNRLQRMARLAGERIRALPREMLEKAPGTAVAGAWIEENVLHTFSCGDSLTLVVRGGHVVFCTVPKSFVQTAVSMGSAVAGEVGWTHRKQLNLIGGAVGYDEPNDNHFDIQQFTLQPGDVVMGVTDGYANWLNLHAVPTRREAGRWVFDANFDAATQYPSGNNPFDQITQVVGDGTDSAQTILMKLEDGLDQYNRSYDPHADNNSAFVTRFFPPRPQIDMSGVEHPDGVKSRRDIAYFEEQRDEAALDGRQEEADYYQYHIWEIEDRRARNSDLPLPVRDSAERKQVSINRWRFERSQAQAERDYAVTLFRDAAARQAWMAGCTQLQDIHRADQLIAMADVNIALHEHRLAPGLELDWGEGDQRVHIQIAQVHPATHPEFPDFVVATLTKPDGSPPARMAIAREQFFRRFPPHELQYTPQVPFAVTSLVNRANAQIEIIRNRYRTDNVNGKLEARAFTGRSRVYHERWRDLMQQNVQPTYDETAGVFLEWAEDMQQVINNIEALGKTI